MAEYDGHVRINLTLDSKGATGEVRSVADAFRRLGKTAHEAISGKGFEAVTSEARNTGEAIKGLRADMDDMTAAEAKTAAALTKKLAEVERLNTQMETAAQKANAALTGLRGQEQTLEDSIRKTTTEAARLQARWDKVNASVNRTREGDLMPGQDKKIAELDKLGYKMADLDDKTKAYQRRLDTVRAKISALNETQLGTGGSQSALKSKLEAAQAEADALKTKLDELHTTQNVRPGSAVKENVGKALASGFKDMRGSAEDAFRSVQKLAQRSFKRIAGYFKPLTKMFDRLGLMARRVFIFGAIIAALRAARDVLNEIIAKDDGITKQLNTIKGNLLAAFKPLWQAVYPAVTAILNVLVAITSALANLAENLFGGLGDGADDAADALNAEAEAIDNVSGSAKKAKQHLGAFDEINQLSEQGGAGGGGGGGGIAGTSGLLTDLSWTFEDIYARLMALDWDMIAARINNALLSIDFVKIGGALREGVSYVVNAMTALLTGIDWKQLGSNIASGLNELLVGDLLPDIAEMLAEWFNAKIQLFYGFVTTFDWAGFGTSLGNSITTFFQTFDWATFAQGFSNFAIGILNALTSAIAATDWTAIGDAVKIALTNIDWEGILISVAELVLAAGLQAFDGLVKGIGDLFGLEVPTFSIEETYSGQNGGGRNSIVIESALATEAVKELILAFANGELEYSQFRDALSAELGLDMTESAMQIWHLRNRLKLGEISAEEFRASMQAMGADDELISQLLEAWGITATSTAESIDDMAIATDNLKLSALGAANDIQLLSDALLASGLSNDKMRQAYSAFTETLAKDQGVEEYRAALVELGFTQSEIDALFVSLGISTGEISTSMETTAESVEDISTGMSDAADSAEDMAAATESVADNSEDAETAIDDENEALTDAKSDAEDAAAAQETLTDATISLSDATSTGAASMSSALSANLMGWRQYATDLAILLAGITEEQNTFWNGLPQGARSAMDGIKSVFDSFASYMSTTFANAWSAVIAAMSDGGTSFKAITDGIGSVVKRAINSLISGINKVFESAFGQLNNILKTLRNTSVYGLKPFGAISTINIPRIPALAQGAVIPANNEFLAILGDQSHGTNIEAPLDTITEAMMLALGNSGALGGASPEAIAAAVRSGLASMTVQFDGEQVGRFVAAQIDANRKADGKFAYDLA